MSGFTKLVPEIVQSSIWNETAEVRIVWITMLAIKDEEGNVRGNIKTLARLANVRDKFVEEAIRKFQEPDPDSNTPEKEGRRIELIPGGWHVINHSVYRAKDYKEHEAERKREYRKRVSGTCPGQVPDSSASASVSVSDKEGMQGEKPDPHKPVKNEVLKTIEGARDFVKLHPAFGSIQNAAIENVFKPYDPYREHWPKMLRQFQTDHAGEEKMKYPPCQQLRIDFDRYIKFNNIRPEYVQK